MGKEKKAPDSSTAPEIDPEHVDLDLDQPDTPLEPTTTIEEAQAAAEPVESKEDDNIYKQASDTVAIDEPEKSKKQKKSKKKLIVTLFVLILLAAGAAAAWYFLLRDKPTQPAAPVTETTQTETPALSYIPETIAYAFRDGDINPYTLFWRPAAGGDRTQVEILNRSAIPAYSDTYGANVAFVADEKLYISTDYGKDYDMVFESEAGAQITGVKLSKDGSRVALSYYPDGADKSTIRSLALNGEDSKDLFTSSANKPGVTILGWDSTSILYTENCYNCGGSAATPYSRNLKDNKSTALLEGVDLKNVTVMAVSGDLSKFLYVEGVDGGATAEGLESGVVAPYKVNLLDLKSDETKTIATIGTAGEKNPNGTAKYRDIKVGFLAGSVIPYYVDDKTLYTVSGSEPNAFYESEAVIQLVPFVSEKTIIIGAGDSTSEYTLTNFDIESSKGVVIFEGDANTTILGVTTK